MSNRKIEKVTVKSALTGDYDEIDASGLLAIRFTLNNGDFIDVSFSNHQEERVPGDSISVRGSRCVVLTPRSGNALLIKCED